MVLDTAQGTRENETGLLPVTQYGSMKCMPRTGQLLNGGVCIVRVFARRALIKFPALQMALFDGEIRYGMVEK